MFSPPNGINGALKSPDVVEQAKMLNAGRINRATSIIGNANSRDIGVYTNSMNSISGVSTNDYLINQKLRNSGLYSKLKNKTIYSTASLGHASLNSGIL